MIGIIFIFSSIEVSADEEMLPVPYRIKLEGENKVFYMTPEGDANKKNLKSGLYSNTELPQMIYPIDHYIPQGELYISSDGRYIADMKHWVYSDMYDIKEDAIIFYEDGIKMNRYAVSDLMWIKYMGSQSVSHLQWDFQDKRVFDKTKNTLSVVTRDGVFISFDLTTGRMVSKISAYFIIWGLILLILLVILLLIKKSKKIGRYKKEV